MTLGIAARARRHLQSTRCRHDRRGWGVCLFIALLLLVAVERRLADAQFNLRATDICFENDERLDGDEIKVRLIGNADASLPAAPPAVASVVERLARPPLAWRARPLVEDCASRAPPAPSSRA